MKVCIIGCGNQGASMAGSLAIEKQIEQLVLADVDLNMPVKVETLLNTLGSRKKVKNIKKETVDGTNTSDVLRVIKGIEVVFNGTIPPCNIPIMKACLKAGVHYIDLYAVPRESPGVPREETLDAQLDMNDDFKTAGLVAIPSSGISPGFTSLAAQYLIHQMDKVDSVEIKNTDLFDSGDVLYAPINPIMMFSHWLGPPGPAIAKNGELIPIGILESEEEFEFLPPVGKRLIYATAGNTDTILVPRFADKPIPLVTEKGAVGVAGLTQKDMWLKALWMQTSKDPSLMNKTVFDLMAKSMVPTANFKEALDKGIVKDGYFASAAIVNGTKNRKKLRKSVYYLCTMKDSLKQVPWGGPSAHATTGVPLELILMLGNGEIKRRGVMTMADIERPDVIFDRMRKKGHIIEERTS